MGRDAAAHLIERVGIRALARNTGRSPTIRWALRADAPPRPTDDGIRHRANTIWGARIPRVGGGHS